MADATITTSVVTGGSNNHATVSEEANAYATDFVTQGVVGTIANTNAVAPCTGSFGVNQDTVPAMSVTVKTGIAYITATPSSQNSQMLRARMTSDTTAHAINANSSGSTKYDWLYLQVNTTNANNPSATADNVAALYTSRSSSNITDNGSPPTYGILLAVVTVANGASSITNANIADRRTSVTLGNGTTAASNGWTTLNYALNYSAANGNRSFNLTATGDLTGTLTPGMRLSIARAVTPPTQCTSLNGTTQYWNKTSGLGAVTFTDDFVVSAWVKLTSYATGIIASRYNGTSGFHFFVASNGQVHLGGFNAGSANFSEVISYQSLPLNKWVHVAAQLDMSSFTATPTTSYIMIDGIDTPASVARGGTNPTALVQAGNLEIGGENGGTNPLPGKVAQVALYSAKVTQATIAAAMNQTMAGSETSLLGFWSFNGNSGTDATSNALNLTAQASATDTTVDSPFNGTEYAIITAASYSAPTTTLTVQTPNTGVIPNQTLNTPQYSGLKIPFGFPTQKDKWTIYSLLGAIISTSGTSTATYYNPGGFNISVPIGAWLVVGAINCQIINSTGLNDSQIALSTSSSTVSDPSLLTRDYISAGGASFRLWKAILQTPTSVTTATKYYPLVYSTPAFSAADIRGSIASGFTNISAECAYL